MKRNSKFIKYTVLGINFIVITYLFIAGFFGDLIISPNLFFGMFLKTIILDPIFWAVIVYFVYLRKVKKSLPREKRYSDIVGIVLLNIFLISLLIFKSEFSAYIIYLMVILNSSIMYFEMFNSRESLDSEEDSEGYDNFVKHYGQN